MTSNLTGAIHLVSTCSGGGHVKLATRLAGLTRHVHVLDEQVAIGPCDVDPERHFELRRAWNAEIGDQYTKTFGIHELHAAVSGDLPIVIWATQAYSDLVWLWWILDGLGQLCTRAQPPILVRPIPDDPYEDVGGIAPEKGVEAIAVARAISDDEAHEGARLWQLFASPDPRAFDEARRRGSSAFPELHERAEIHGAWFPRIHDGRLHLSEYDQCLLTTITDEWRKPAELLRPPTAIAGWERLLKTFGYYAIPVCRLRVWAARGIIEREFRDHAHGNLLEQDVFRRTDKTRDLLSNGLTSVGESPSMHVGGCRIYDPKTPWVRVSDEAGWQLTVHT